MKSRFAKFSEFLALDTFFCLLKALSSSYVNILICIFMKKKFLSQSTQQNLIYVMESATLYTKLGTKYRYSNHWERERKREIKEKRKLIINLPHVLIQKF